MHVCTTHVYIYIEHLQKYLVLMQDKGVAI